MTAKGKNSITKSTSQCDKNGFNSTYKPPSIWDSYVKPAIVGQMLQTRVKYKSPIGF